MLPDEPFGRGRTDTPPLAAVQFIRPRASFTFSPPPQGPSASARGLGGVDEGSRSSRREIVARMYADPGHGGSSTFVRRLPGAAALPLRPCQPIQPIVKSSTMRRGPVSRGRRAGCFECGVSSGPAMGLATGESPRAYTLVGVVPLRARLRKPVGTR